jgi:hypothetical protein
VIRKGRRTYRRRFRSSRGVVSVVGTLLALLVFFALFGVFVTQYVPVWMSDNEAAYVSKLQVAFATLKQDIDFQTLAQGPAVLSVPVPLSSDGIPLFAAPTVSQLAFYPHSPGIFVNVSMQYGPGGQPKYFNNQSLGTLQLSDPNRYFPAQQFTYMAGAVVQGQGASHQVVAYPPLFQVNTSGRFTTVSFVVVQLYGNATEVASAGTQEVYSSYVNQASFRANGSNAPGGNFSASILLGGPGACAWSTYFNNTLGASGLAAGQYTITPTPTACNPSPTGYGDVRVTFAALSTFALSIASLDIATGVGIS